VKEAMRSLQSCHNVARYLTTYRFQLCLVNVLNACNVELRGSHYFGGSSASSAQPQRCCDRERIYYTRKFGAECTFFITQPPQARLLSALILPRAPRPVPDVRRWSG
jgi:hypothetical protein